MHGTQGFSFALLLCFKGCFVYIMQSFLNENCCRESLLLNLPSVESIIPKERANT